MMRIKEAIQRRKLIQQLNDEYLATQIDTEPHHLSQKRFSAVTKLSCTTSHGGWATSSAGEDGGDEASKQGQQGTTDFAALAESHEAYISLAQFVGEFNGRLTDGHRRALRVTWNRLSEPPKTSGRGILKIMERIFEELIAKNPEVMHCFYKSAFLKCLEDRKRRVRGTGTIVTIRDHAHLLIELIDGIMCTLFDVPHTKPVWDPVAIGRVHARLIPFGFQREIWHSLGAVLAEVMFCQECVRAYPLAASAWSMLSVALTDRMFRHTKMPNHATRTLSGHSQLEWSQSKQNSLNNDASLLQLSADLQKKAMISLRGTGQLPGSTASSFRRVSESVKKQRLEQQQLREAKRKSLSMAQRQRSVSRDGRLLSQSSVGGRRRSSSTNGDRKTSTNAATSKRQHPKLEKAPSFFSRTIASLASPMPSSTSFDSKRGSRPNRRQHSPMGRLDKGRLNSVGRLDRAKLQMPVVKKKLQKQASCVNSRPPMLAQRNVSMNLN